MFDADQGNHPMLAVVNGYRSGDWFGVVLRLVGAAGFTWGAIDSWGVSPPWVTAATVIGVASWLLWTFTPRASAGLTSTTLAIVALAGASTAGDEHGAGLTMAAVALGFTLGSRVVPVWTSALIGCATVVVAQASGLFYGVNLGQQLLILGPLALAGLAGVVAKQRRTARLEQAELTRQAIELGEQRMIASEQSRVSAALAERARIAREIHDVLAHTLGALSVQLDAADALVEAGRLDEARQRIRGSRGLAVNGLTDVRDAIAMLRADSGQLSDAVTALIDRHRETYGVEILSTTRGVARSLSPELVLALERITQESLTNAAKHAAGCPLVVEVDFGDPDRVGLRVTTQGTSESSLAAFGGHNGIAGMRERAEALGGTVSAGSFEAGWRVEASIPEEASLPETTSHAADHSADGHADGYANGQPRGNRTSPTNGE